MGTRQFNMHEAKTKLSELGELAWKGERIIIAKAGKPFLDLFPHKSVMPNRVPGRFKNTIVIHDDFDKTPDSLIDDFEGNE